MGAMISRAVEYRIVWLTIEGYASCRDILYEKAIELAHRSPAWGVGLGGFAAITGWAYPHNIFLEFLCEGGVIALLLFAAAMVAFAAASWRNRGMLDVTSLAAFVVMFVASQFSGNLYDSRSVFVLPVLAMAPATKQASARARKLMHAGWVEPPTVP